MNAEVDSSRVGGNEEEMQHYKEQDDDSITPPFPLPFARRNVYYRFTSCTPRLCAIGIGKRCWRLRKERMAAVEGGVRLYALPIESLP